ncbi:MAG TPA: hypothetical protein VEX18_06535, partial [Polyangiaceae bacterium]|nr:hypothetical protein [Polyangiaceae bacterium]
MSKWSWVLGASLPWVLAAPACGNSGDSQCVNGHAGCLCTADSRCVDGSTCDSNDVCVASNGSSGGAGGGVAGTGGSGTSGGTGQAGGAGGSDTSF